jgi:hypothetical protein
LRDRLDGTLRRALDDAARANLARSLLAIASFQQAVDLLAENSVPVCPLKGIELLGTIYAAEPEARVLSDVDLLVAETVAGRAAELLIERLDYRDATAPAGWRHERSLVRDAGRIDVHWRLGSRFARAGTWETLAPRDGELHHRRVWRLAPEATFVHLAAHAANHGLGLRLGWLEDLVRLGPELDEWRDSVLGSGISSEPPSAPLEERLVAVANRLGARRALLAALAAARAWGGPELLSGVGPGPLDRLPLALYARLVPIAASEALTRRHRRATLRLASLLLADTPAQALHIVATTLRRGMRA